MTTDQTPDLSFAFVRSLCQAEGLTALACIRPPTALDPVPFDRMVADGLGDMGWISDTREQRLNPTAMLPTARSLLVTAWAYSPDLNCDGLKRARYGAGKDYHHYLRRKLGRVGAALTKHGLATCGEPWDQRAAVDSAPINERTLARMAGLGWLGRNALLISPDAGSYRFLGVLLTEAPIAAHRGPHGEDRCGKCTRCETACPTGALVDRRVISTRCISYLTIEHNGPIPRDLALRFDGWWFGCDICQEVCPWNRFAAPAADPRLTGHEADAKLLAVTAADFDLVFAARAVRRLGYERFRRNLLVALASQGRFDECRPIIAEGLPVVLEQARELGIQS
jgi:epoxyqueuosine reductase